MMRPDLTRMWETFVRIGPASSVRSGRHIERLRIHLTPLIERLTELGLVSWYCFLIHGRTSGVPTPAGDEDSFWHVRLSLATGRAPEDLLAALSPECAMTRHVPVADLTRIAGLESARLTSGDIEDAWKVIGEQSQWLMETARMYRDDLRVDEMNRELRQYLHFFANMAQLQVT